MEFPRGWDLSSHPELLHTMRQAIESDDELCFGATGVVPHNLRRQFPGTARLKSRAIVDAYDFYDGLRSCC